MNDAVARSAILRTIDGGHAYIRFAEIVADFPPDHYNTRPANVPYTFWHLLEHIRICIDRMLEKVQGDQYRHLAWPKDYWPAPDAVAGAAEWQATVDAIAAGMAETRRWATDPGFDLGRLARHANGDQNQTVLYELIDIAIHNAYHIGEFAILRQVMGLWPEGHQ